MPISRPHLSLTCKKTMASAEPSVQPIVEPSDRPTNMPKVSAKDIKSLKLILSEEQHFSCKISIQSNFKEICNLIKENLNRRELERFRETQFGHLLDVPDHYQHSSQLMWFFILRQIETNKDKELWMLVNGTPMRFSMEEYALITGLNFAPGPDKWRLDMARNNNRLRDKYFGVNKRISVHDLKKKLADMGPWEDDDKLKIALILFLVGVLRAQRYKSSIDIGLMGIVDDIDLFDSCDWGVKTYEYTLNSLRKDIVDKADALKRKCRARGSTMSYTFGGFVHAFQTWAYEMVPAVANKFAIRRDGNVLPRMLRWKTRTWNDKNSPTYREIEEIFRGDQIIQSLLVPTEEEKSLMYMSCAIMLNDYADPIIDRIARNLRSAAVIRQAEAVCSTPSTNPAERDDETPSMAHFAVPPPPPMTVRDGASPPQEPPITAEPIESLNQCSQDFDERLPQMESRLMSQIAAQMAQNAAQIERISTQMEARFLVQISQVESRLMALVAHTNVGCHTPDDRAAADQDHIGGDASIRPVELGDSTNYQMSEEVDPRNPPTRINDDDHVPEEGGVLEEVMSEIDGRPFKMRKCSVENMKSAALVDLTNEENVVENGSNFHGIETPGLELEARISRLEIAIRKLKRARFSH